MLSPLVSEQLLRSLSQASGAGASAIVTTILIALGANLLVAVAERRTPGRIRATLPT